MAWGASLPPWPPPPSRSIWRGPAPLSLAPINRGEVGGKWNPHPRHSPPPPQHLLLLPRRLAKPCRSTTLLQHHHAVVLLLDGVFPNLSLSPCWIKAWETSPGCMCVERGGAVVRRLDRNQPRSESLRVRLPHPRSCNASASRSTMVCRCTPLSPCC